jgi:3-phosphoshikimate 1-carboxyvinyltransferase
VGGVPHAPDGPLDAHNDHRVAMSLAVLALASGRGGAIDGAEAVEKSWPDFWRVLRALGAKEAADAR